MPEEEKDKGLWYILTHYFSQKRKFLDGLKEKNQRNDPEEIIQEEKMGLQVQEKIKNQEKITGLAISGGGIRSASFGLGVMQALVSNDKLKDIDYLSTVSGGGYIGSALTWALHQDPEAGLEPHNFPFRRKDTLSQEEGTLQDYIRQHRNYLAPTSSLDIISFAAIVIRGMVMSVFAYFSLLAAAIAFILALFYLIEHWFLLLKNSTDLIITIEAIVFLILLGFLILKRILKPNHKLRLFVEISLFSLMIINIIFLFLSLIYFKIDTLLITVGAVILLYFIAKGFADSVGGVFSLLIEVSLFFTLLEFIIVSSSYFFDGAAGNFEKDFMTYFYYVIAASLLLFFLLKRLINVHSKDETKWASKKYNIFIEGQKRMGLLLKIGMAFVVFGSFHYLFRNHSFSFLHSETVKQFFENSTVLLAIVFTLFGTLIGVWHNNRNQKKENTGSKSSGVLIYSVVFAILFGLIYFAYTLAVSFLKWFMHDTSVIKSIAIGKTNPLPPQFYLVFLVIAIFIILIWRIGRRVDLNIVGPHQLWRNRLMETFMPDQEAVKENKWKPATRANNTPMEDMCNASRYQDKNPGEALKKPYHIINTNIILTNSPRSNYRSRGGDNFIISPLYCGSSATAWVKTNSYQKTKRFLNLKPFNAFHEQKQGITLATAMSVSAAALNPNAGVSGQGVSRNSAVSFLLSLLNLRLGYWTSNPQWPNPLGFNANLISPGLTSEILKTGLTEKNKYVQLSDGGHFENLGLYELVRRKLDLIIVSDGGADAGYNFDDLANAIEKVRVDFGAVIRFRDGFLPGDILPGTAGKSFFQKKYNISKRGFAIGDIIYNDGKTPNGTLVYLKLAMISNLPTDVYSYKGVNPTFPHESTADQFFNEKQFEAYRELGYHVGWQMMESAEYEDGEDIFPHPKDPTPAAGYQGGNMSMRINGKKVVGDRNTSASNDINDVGIEVADWLTDLYRDFQEKQIPPFVSTEPGPATSEDFPTSGQVEVELNYIIYKFTFESLDFPDTPDSKDFYVKSDPNERDTWHATTAQIRRRRKDRASPK
jgi:Patatin-like phospholipase